MEYHDWRFCVSTFNSHTSVMTTTGHPIFELKLSLATVLYHSVLHKNLL